MKNGIIPKHLVIMPLLVLSVVFCFSCTGTQVATESVIFAVFGNTSPESPFTGFTKSLPGLLDEIESYKPQIIVHTGDAIYGGSASDGILETDIKRQLGIFFPSLKKLRTAVYTIPGDRDFYNGTIDLFTGYSGRLKAYSFNYGSIHFICLFSSAEGDSIIDNKQAEWLKRDLDESGSSSATFVFAHHQMFPEKKKNPQLEKNEELHRLFIGHNVKAVFSGSEKNFSNLKKDSIEYINAGCSASKDRKDRRSNRFYIINYNNSRLDIEPVQ